MAPLRSLRIGGGSPDYSREGPDPWVSQRILGRTGNPSSWWGRGDQVPCSGHTLHGIYSDCERLVLSQRTISKTEYCIHGVFT